MQHAKQSGTAIPAKVQNIIKYSQEGKKKIDIGGKIYFIYLSLILGFIIKTQLIVSEMRHFKHLHLFKFVRQLL